MLTEKEPDSEPEYFEMREESPPTFDTILSSFVFLCIGLRLKKPEPDKSFQDPRSSFLEAHKNAMTLYVG